MKLGSLFDGSGGFSLAGTVHGVVPVWASEIEPYPIGVTKLRFPNMKHLGSVVDINGAEIEPVDIVTFGSPCQDLSVAGKQKGIYKGERSNLFFEAVRIVKEMRANDRAAGRSAVDIRPRYLVWENVPGAFSSDKGEDFRAVLEAIIGIAEKGLSVPGPPKGKWNHAGCVVGDGWSIAWRVYDAQYWGVPQRRKRIYLVADLADEREGVRGYFAEGGTPWQGSAAHPQGSAGADDRTGEGAGDGRGLAAVNPVPYTLKVRCGKEGGGKGALIQTDMSATLATNNDQYLFQSGANASGGHYIAEGGPAPALRTEHPPGVAVRYIVRRLTPTECARLQGFADRWGDIDQKDSFTDEEYRFWLEVRNTHAAINGKPIKDYTMPQMLTWYNKLHTDSAEYKMWGNGIALPCAVDVLGRIARQSRKTKEEMQCTQ